MATFKDHGDQFELLNHYVHHLEELITTLEVEHDSLCNRDLDALEQCTVRKQDLLTQLATLKQESNTTPEHTASSGSDKPEAEDMALNELKARIRSLLETCQHQNEINGAIIDVSSQFNQRMLEIILGVNGTDNTYDSDGKSSNQLSGHTVAKI